MWLLTTIGFHSIVAHRDDPDLVIVRARTREDIEALSKRYLPVDEIDAETGTDYPFWIFVARDEFERTVATLARDIDYDNVKNAVAARQGHGRADLYHDISGLLRRLQRLGGDTSKSGR